ncbi:MAG: L-rhamnose mutarotase [Parvibaculales bacterium]
MALDLKEDAELIRQYEEWHKKGAVWPEILQTLYDTTISDLEIYRVGNRMFMILEADENFSLEEKGKQDANNPKVQEWEDKMWEFQKPLPFAKEGEKWLQMKRIFSLKAEKE